MILNSNSVLASLEAMLFAAGDPVEPAKLAEVLIYVLAFSLIGAVSFLPGVKKNSDDSASCKNNDETVDEQ